MSKKTRSAFLDTIQYGLFLIPVGLIRICSLKVAYALARFVGRMFYLLDVRHRNRTIRHILHSGVRTTLPEAKKLAKANMIHLVKVFVEIIKFDQIITPENVHEYISVDDTPTAKKMLSKETAIQTILTTAHLGNWELAGGTYTALTGIPMTSIMRPLGNKKIGDYFYRHRASFAHKTTSKELGIRPLLLAHKAGETITIVADQHANSREGVEVTYFGHPARAHATPALLHLKTRTPLFSPCLIRLDDQFHFRFYCTEPFVYEPTGDRDADIRTICQKYTENIEETVRRFPEQWLWAHRRWLDIERGHDSEYKDGKKIEQKDPENDHASPDSPR